VTQILGQPCEFQVEAPGRSRQTIREIIGPGAPAVDTRDHRWTREIIEDIEDIAEGRSSVPALQLGAQRCQTSSTARPEYGTIAAPTISTAQDGARTVASDCYSAIELDLLMSEMDHEVITANFGISSIPTRFLRSPRRRPLVGDSLTDSVD
jgi:hypothetical protein